MENTFSVNLRRIRKEKGVTQEQLANMVGVSAQAVSKWEISSYPDAGLLPAISDCLGVTIDELFGKMPEKEISMYQKIINYLRAIPRGDILRCSAEGEALREDPPDLRMDEVFQICRACVLGYMGVDEYAPIAKSVLEAEGWETHSQVTMETGWMQTRLNGNLQYFLMMRSPECGYDSVLKYDEKMVGLFQFLSKPDALRAVYFLAGRPTTILFTVNALASELGISEENARDLIKDMLELNFIWEADLNNGQGETQAIYQWLVDCNFVSFINFTRTLLHRPNSFNYQTSNKCTPFFINDTYKNNRSGGTSDETKKE